MMNVQNLLLQWYKRTSAPLIVTLLLFVLVGFGTSAYSQSARWVAGADTAGTAAAVVPFNSTITGATTTGNGDVIVCGQYTGRIDFTLVDGSIVSLPTNNTTVSGRASFVARYDSLGRAIWVRGIDAGITFQALAVGIVFDGTVSPARVMVAVNANAAIVNPSPGLPPIGGFDGFLLGLDTAGIGLSGGNPSIIPINPINIATAGPGDEFITAISSNGATTSANYRIGVVGTYTQIVTINATVSPAQGGIRSAFATTKNNVGGTSGSNRTIYLSATNAGELAHFAGVAFDATNSPTGADSLVAVGYYRTGVVTTVVTDGLPVRTAGQLFGSGSVASVTLPVSAGDDYVLIKMNTNGADGRIALIATGGTSQHDRAMGVAVDQTTGNTFVTGIIGDGHTTGPVPIANFTTRVGSLPTTVELTDTAGGGRTDMFLLQYSTLRIPIAATQDLTDEGASASITPILASVNTARGRGDDGGTAITLRRRPLSPAISEPIVTGYFSNTATFSNGPVKKSLVSTTGRDAFILGFNEVHLYVNSMGGSGTGLTASDSSHDAGTVIVFGATPGNANLLGGVQSEGRIYVGGTFNQKLVVDRFLRSRGINATPPIELRKVTAGQGHFIGMFKTPSDSANAGIAEIRVNNSVNALFASGSRPVQLLVKNYGGTRMDSVSIFVEVNGTLRDNFLQLFNVLPFSPIDPNGEALITLPNVTFPDYENVTIKAWTSRPNGQNRDKQITNDTAYFSRGASLSGIVTIGPARNFNTITNAINFVTMNGVLGPVQFLIADGLYQERIFINNKIPGSSLTNNIKFESLSGSRLSATIQSPTQTVPELAYTVRIDSCDHVSFAKMSINATGDATPFLTNPGGAAVILNANTDSVTFNDVLISGVLLNEAQSDFFFTNSINFNNIRVNQDNNSNGLQVWNSTVQNGTFGVNKVAHGGGLNARNIVIQTNEFTTNQNSAVALSSTLSALVQDNIVNFPPARETRFAFNFDTNFDSLKVIGNTLRVPRANGIQIIDHTSTLTTRALVYNNMVSVGNGIDADNLASLSISTSSNIFAAHNSLYSTSPSNNVANSNVRIITSPNTIFVNNISYSQGNGLAFAGPALSIDAGNTNLRSDYNSFFSRFPNNMFDNNGVGIATISAWRTATNQDLQSTRNLITTFNNPTTGNLRLTLVDTTKDNFTQQFTRELRGTRDTINTFNGPVNVRQLVRLDVDKATRRYPYKGADEVFTIISVGTNPVDVTVCRLKDTSLSVVATINFGSVVGFQWFKDGIAVNSPSATLPQLMINQPTFDSTGVYSVRMVDFITGVADTVFSDSVLFYVLGKPEITATIVSVNVPNSTTPAALSVVLDGLTSAFSSQPTFRWFKNNVLVSNDANITGATTNVIEFAVVRPADVGLYFSIVDGLCGSDTSVTMYLSIPTTTVTAVGAGTFCVGEAVTLSGTKTVTGASPGSVLTGQWYRNGMPVFGLTADTVMFDSVLVSQAGSYQFKATLNPGNIEVVSTPVVVNVVAPVEILSVMGNNVICSNDTATLTVMTNASGNMFQWWIVIDNNGQDSLDPIAGDTNTSFKTNMAGRYAVSVVGLCGDIVVSDIITVSTSILPSFVSASDDTILAPNSSVLTLRAEATGTEVLLYQWWKIETINGQDSLVPIAGAINPVFVRSPFRVGDAGRYRVSVTNVCGTVVYGQEIVVGLPVSVLAGEEFAFQLGDANPNPFFNETVINFTIPQQMNVTLDITDIFGKRVATLLETVLPAGKHSTVFNAEKYGVGSGTYFYNINGNGMKLSRKMMYVK